MAASTGNGVNNSWSMISENKLSETFPLHRACRDGDVGALTTLLQHEAAKTHITIEDEYYGWTPTHWAAYFGKLDCLRVLVCGVGSGVSTPTDVITSRFSQTPAHIAAFAGHPHCLQWLLQSGADVNAKDYLGETPLHKAARTGSSECVGLLVANKALIRVTNNNGQIPAQLAVACNYAQLANHLLELQVKEGGLSETKKVITSTIPGHGLNGGVFPNSGDLPCLTTTVFSSNGIDKPHTSSNGYYGFQSSVNSIKVETNGHSNGHATNHMNDDGDCDMETDSPVLCNGQSNGHTVPGFTNGLTEVYVPSTISPQSVVTGMEKQNGSHVQNQENELLKISVRGQQVNNNGIDITLIPEISQNHISIGGRKRSREEGSIPEMKRMRVEGPRSIPRAEIPTPPPLPTFSFKQIDSNIFGHKEPQNPYIKKVVQNCSHMESKPIRFASLPINIKCTFGQSSVVDHSCSVRVEKSYDSLSFEAFMTEMHGC